ncbi:MAG: hypothetical protein CL840_06860 [Crocinitomicaceae bacterium]|nr:hypothetical protein [Crocinitomicaceae bacterium]|tara:strand:+ start:23547 stop:24797 length:1251 start_codon:yes stop_codon:yes gene_type:complete
MMKTIKLLLLIPILGLAGFAYSANLTITGKVTDNGVAKANVQVIYVDSNTNNMDTALTNSAGNYTITLNVGSATQGIAVGYITDCKRKYKYNHIFYTPRTTTYSNYNFVYCTGTPGGGNKLSTVSGMVYNDSNLAGNGIVILIEKNGLILKSVDTMKITRGWYSFTLPDSTLAYYVKAILDKADSRYRRFLPTYSDKALKWSKAKLIGSGNNMTHTRDIRMVRGRNTGGPGFVGGNVRRGANKSSATGDPIEGAQIMLLQGGDAVAYTYSDAQGNFSIDDLAYGTYTVYTEEAGLPTVTADVTVSAAAPKEEGVRVTINSSGVTTSVEVVGIESTGVFTQLRAFPNPVQDNFTIEFGTQLNNVNISILDLTGKVIDNQELVNSSEVNLSFSDLPKGSYLIRVNALEENSVIRVVKH